ncbi:MAG: YkgJ family cysteine cluster protein [Vampirovibrionia bacterium]
MNRYFESIENYKELLNKVDELTESLKQEYSDDINCKEGCCSCCNNIFNISIIEGVYLQEEFKKLHYEIQEEIIKNIHIIKKELDNNPDKRESIHCPLLINKHCALYSSRPIICRTFGYPMIDEKTGNIATCELNFLDLRDDEYTLKTISSKLLSANTALLSKFYLSEIGKNFDEKYIPSLYSILEILLSEIE